MTAISRVFSGAFSSVTVWHRLLAAGVLLVSLGWLPTAGAATALSAADEKSVRSVIQAQLAAFAKDDAAAAFSYAAPNVRKAFGSPAVFLKLVQNDYPVVYRPASVAFLKPEGQANDAIQRVQMEDANGDSWLATYTLQRQKNKSWRITGCSVVENKGRMA